ncbi:MAG: NAD-dependent epimerase/dehydratase family protein [Pedococcus sp.]
MIAVVGGAGRLGRLVVQGLRKHGEEVLVVARKPPATPSLDEGVRHATADVREAAPLHAAISADGC